jgi:predicted MFS family arabinose efflux permease
VAGLHRNRDFVLLQAGQLLSAFGGAFTTVAYPLLVLALTHSPAKAGIVSFARTLLAPLFGLAAGLAADRFDRRRLMLSADAVRAAAVATLAALVAAHPVYWPIPLLAFVEGTGEALFTACQTAAVRAVVPPDQLPAAVSVQTGRAAAVGLAGPPAGGALFGVSRAAPFIGDAASYAFSLLSLLAMRTPFQERRERETTPLRTRLAEGSAFLWRQPFLRVTSFLYGVENLTIPGLLFLVVVIARRHGLTGGEIGLLLAAFSACTLLGSLLAARARRRLSPREIMLLELYTGLLTSVVVVFPSVYVLAAAILPQAVVLPITDSVVVSRRLVLTPDRLLGRVEAVRATVARAASPLGPLAAGLLLGATSTRTTVAVFVAVALAIAAWGTATPALRA